MMKPYLPSLKLAITNAGSVSCNLSHGKWVTRLRTPPRNLRVPEERYRIVGKPSAQHKFRRCSLGPHSASGGSSLLPGLARRHLPEALCLPDLPNGICRKHSASRTCQTASAGSTLLPGLARRHPPEALCLPHLPDGIRRKHSASRTCRLATWTRRFVMRRCTSTTRTP
jgi:hypothetical protein